MMRARYSWTNPRTLLTAACCVAAVLSLLPWKYSFWVQAPANLLSVFVAPLQNGFTKVLSPIAVKRGAGGSGTGAEGADVEAFRTLYLQMANENRQLRAQIEVLQRGIKLYADTDTQRVITPSLGLRGSLLQLRTDLVSPRPDGSSPIGTGSVVVLEGVNLVGRVVAPGAKVTLVQLVADAAGREIRGVVRPNETEGGASDLPGQLEYGVKLTPTPDGGRLTGSVFLLPKAGSAGAAGKKPEPIQPGARVRLADPEWPRFAQMLILGEVESVSTAQNDRQTVIVRPMYEVRELAGAEFTLLIQPPLNPSDTPLPPAAPTAKPKGSNR